MDLKSYVQSIVDPVAYYTAVFPAWNSASHPNVPCPFHDDHSPSLAVGLNGGGAKCHAASCGVSIGNIVHFESRLRGVSEDAAAETIYDRFVRPVVPQQAIRYFQDCLRTPAGVRLSRLVASSHGLTEDVTSQFGCGYDPRANRLVIPVENAYGLVVNLRFYKPRKLRNPNEPTLYNYVTDKGKPTERRYGGNELFPWPKLKHLTDDYPVFIMASEKETMLAYQLGLQAVCATAGEGSWQTDWSELFTGRRVGILMDPDTGGEKATARLVRELSSVSLFSVPIKLPFQRGFRGPQDFDDWVVHSGGTAERLLVLFEQLRTGNAGPQRAVAGARRTTPGSPVKRILPPDRASVPAGNGSVERLGVPPATGPKLPTSYAAPDGSDRLAVDAIRRTPGALNRIVTSHGLVAGLAQRSYSVPFKFRLSPRQGPPRIYVMDVGRALLGFIGAGDDAVCKAVLQLCNTNRNTAIEAIEHHTVTELELIPLADQAVASGDEGAYTVQRCFAFGVDVQANLAYAFRLVPTTMPQTQETVGIILEAKELDKQEEFQLTDELSKRFQHFAPSEKGSGDTGATVWKRLELLAAEVSEHHTHIYERPDWHMVVFLTFFCPLQWTWPMDGKTQRGWMNTLAVGDTKTGKSEVTSIVTSQLLKAGSIINSENCTMVGLVGGAIKGASGQFMLRWGRIPLADRKLVVLEELSGLSVEEISNMSDVRSSGVARLDKGGLASQTPARTRLLCLSNVRSKTKRLADFLSGVKAVQELVGHAEDISRFDLIITLTDDEVSADVINRASSRRVTRPAWSVTDLRLLCQWVWSLRPEHIDITPEAARRCLELTLELGKDYHSGVPIFKASSDRHKVARIGVAIACLQFSWDGNKVVVNPCHMEAAAKLLRALYDKPNLGYREWSRQMFDRENIRDVGELNNVFASVQPDARLRARSAEVMIHSAKFSRDELCATATLTITQADLFLGTMLRCRATRKGEANTWEITPAGKRWLEETIVSSENVTSQRNGHSKSRPSFSELFDKA